MHSLIHTKDKQNSEILERLRALNFNTRKKLEVQMDRVRELEAHNRRLVKRLSGIDTGPGQDPFSHRLAPQITSEQLRLINIHQKSEFEVLPYVAINPDRMYQLESGMLTKPEAAPMGINKLEQEQVIDQALEILNTDRKWKLFNKRSLFYGYYRTDRLAGTEYELFFKSKDEPSKFKHVQLFRPFAPVQEVKVQSYSKNELINLIIPLSGRIDSFKIFLSMFVEVCIKGDQNVHITVVYFGIEGRDEAKKMLETTAKENDYDRYTFIEKNEPFSRGVGLFTGAEAWKDGNTLLFFCDVDIVFKEGFLDRCRLNAHPMTKVFYPVVFSLYNPSIVYKDVGQIPKWDDQLILKRDAGFWRTFGFGMTCMYRSDFLFMRGFDTNIQGWGMEDVRLYRKFAQNNLNIIRAPDPGIFHLWHPKVCDLNLPDTQYEMCLKSKALNEASQEQLGLLAFQKLGKKKELQGVESDGKKQEVNHDGMKETIVDRILDELGEREAEG